VGFGKGDKAEPVDNSKEALTKLFEEARVEKTPVIIDKIVEDKSMKWSRLQDLDGCDDCIWRAGNTEIPQKTLLKYQLHKDQGTVRQGVQIP